MERRRDRADVAQDVSFWMSDMAFSRFRSFCDQVLGIRIDEIPSEQSILMKQNFSVVFYASILFLLTNGFYLVKNVVLKTMIPIDMIPLYMMVAASLAMLAFVTAYKDYGSQLARFGLLAFYTVVIAGVTVFMVSCNYHNIGLSISMCYLFVIMVAPTYQALDTAIVCLLIAVSWWLPGRLPYAENYDLFKHFLLRFSIVAGFISIRHIFIRQSANERSVKEMSNAFVKLAYNDVMTGTLNKKALETYCAFGRREADARTGQRHHLRRGRFQIVQRSLFPHERRRGAEACRRKRGPRPRTLRPVSFPLRRRGIRCCPAGRCRG